ncbi:unnamed protein product [Menidia menidia]|uniref:(Atlantic silverside) hypothetical protein n=1 Tax=Menidia menidia TaxID=238744 RepID=A0A8S4BQI9_9TELE|nr:unnamed protein product [Menidia menidia]
MGFSKKGQGALGKRRCVLTKKQPYSGDEWCSGPDTDDEDKLHANAQRERGLAGPVQVLSDRLLSEPGVPLLACGVLKTEPPQPSQQLNSSSSPPTGTPKSQSGTPRPASAGVGGGHSDTDSPQTRGAPGGTTPGGLDPGNGDPPGGGPPLPVGTTSPSGSPSILSAHLQGDGLQRSGPPSTDGLSREQLEHRERSLQTLRDIERLFLRTGAGGGTPGDPGVSNNPNLNNPNNPNNMNTNSNPDRGAIEDTGSGNCVSGSMLSSALTSVGGMKKYEEPLQSIISQTRSLGGAALDSPEMESHHHQSLQQHPHHQMSSPGEDMGPLIGPEGLTREQMAWRKLQEEYYQEKRRQQEMQPPAHPQHFRMMTEVGMHGGGPVMMRGPPPPYHSKPGEQHWNPAGMMGGGMGGNGRIMDMNQDGPRGPRFMGQMPRGQPGGGAYPCSPGGGLPIESIGPQRPNRPGMIWLEDMPNNIGGGQFHGCYTGGNPQVLQGDPELLTREEMFRIMEKRHMQGVSRFELDRLAKQHQQQQGNAGARIMDGLGGPDFPNLAMRGPHPGRGDPMDFPSSREIICSPGPGPQMDSPLGGGVTMGMNPQMNLQQQQMMLSQRLRGGHPSLGEMFGPGEISRMSSTQNGRGGNKGMIPGPDGPFQFPNHGPFPGNQAGGPYLQQPEMFGPDQPGPNPMGGGTSRLSHMPLTGGLRGAELGPRNQSEISVNPLSSPSGPSPHQLKSPSLNQKPSPLLPSPSAPGLKSPLSSAGHHPPLPPASGAGTPCSSSVKSPQILGSSGLGLHSPAASPGHLKSPVMAVGSPGWASPKTALPSPGNGPGAGKMVGNGGSSSTETGTLLPRPKMV